MDLQLNPEPDSDEDSDMYSDDGPSGEEDGGGDVDVDGDDEEYGEDGRPGKRKSLSGSGQETRKRRRVEGVRRLSSSWPSRAYSTQATPQVTKRTKRGLRGPAGETLCEWDVVWPECSEHSLFLGHRSRTC